MGDAQLTRKPIVSLRSSGELPEAIRRARIVSIEDPGAAAHHASERTGFLGVGGLFIGIQAPFPNIAAQVGNALQGMALRRNADRRSPL